MCKLGILVENANNAVRSFTGALGEVMTAHCNCAFALLFCYYHTSPLCYCATTKLLCCAILLCFTGSLGEVMTAHCNCAAMLIDDSHAVQHTVEHSVLYCVWSCWVCLQCNTIWCLMLVQCNAKQWCSMHLLMRCQRSSVAGYRWPSPPPPTAAITILFFLLCCYYYSFCYDFTIILAAITMLL